MKNPNFLKIKTKSGVPLWLLPMPHSGSVSAGVLVNVGTRDEVWPKEAGIAHALEHMLIQGTEEFPTQSDLTSYIEDVGGHINAMTWKEGTFYHAKVPANFTERAIHAVSQQVRKSTLPEEKIATEMNNIIQEIKRSNDNPQQSSWNLSCNIAFNNHSLSKNVLGIEESVSALTKEDFIKFKEKYYNPANYTFVVAGNITKEKILKLFDKYFPEKVSNQKKNVRKTESLARNKGSRNIQTKDIGQLHLTLSATTAPAKSKDAVYLGFFADMIDAGWSFPLMQEIRNKRGLCYDVGAYVNGFSDVGLLRIYVGTDPKKYKEAASASLEVLNSSKADKNLLERAKKLRLGRLALSFENTMNIISRAAHDINFTGKPKDYSQEIKETKSVSIKNIINVVDKYLKPEMFYTSILAPKNFKE